MVRADAQGACSAAIAAAKLAVVSPTNIADLASLFASSGELLVAGSDELSPGIAMETDTGVIMTGSQQAAWGDFVTVSKSIDVAGQQ